MMMMQQYGRPPVASGMAPPRLAPPPVAPPVAHGWTEHKAPDGRPYFYNSVTRVSSYDRPIELKSPQEKAAAAAAAAAKAAPVVIAAAAASTAPAAKTSSPVPATTAAPAAAAPVAAPVAAPASAPATAPAAASPAIAAPAVPAVVAPPVVAKPAAPAVPVVIPKCKWKAYDGPGGRKYYSDGKSSLWDKPKELKEYEAAVAAAAAAAKLTATTVQPAPAAATVVEPESASPVATMAAAARARAVRASADAATPASNGDPEPKPEAAVELVGFGGANGVALKLVETPSSPDRAVSPAQQNGNGSGAAKSKAKKKAPPVQKIEYNTEEEKKEAFIEMLKECEVTSTTKARSFAFVGGTVLYCTTSYECTLVLFFVPHVAQRRFEYCATAVCCCPLCSVFMLGSWANRKGCGGSVVSRRNAGNVPEALPFHFSSYFSECTRRLSCGERCTSTVRSNYFWVTMRSLCSRLSLKRRTCSVNLALKCLLPVCATAVA